MLVKQEGSWWNLFQTVALLEDKRKTQLVTTTAIALASVPLWLLFLRKIYQDRKKNYPPGPPGVFFFGNALQVPNPKQGGFVEEKLLEWSYEYGLLYTISFPMMGREIVILDPDFAKFVLVSKNYDKGMIYKLLSPVIGSKSLVAVNGKEWSLHRRAFNPGFAPTFLRTMTITMAEKLERFIDCIEQQDIASNQATAMLERAQTFTSDVIVAVAFGEDWGGTDPHPARSWETELCRLLAGVFLDPIKIVFGVGTNRDITRYEKLLDTEMMNILKRRLEAAAADQADTQRNSTVTAKPAKDICSIAIEHLKGEDGTLTEEDKIAITHQLKTFYFAGHDTTASLIAWTCWLLSQNSHVLEKIREELETLGIWTDKTTPPPEYDQLQKCTYLEAVLKETLRLYPPVTFLPRGKAGPNDTYKGYDIGGCTLGINVYGMHRHPDLWKDPNSFQPERFLDGSSLLSEDNLQNKFLAFSRGPRDCIGKHFALLEAKLAISALAMRYDMECVDPTDRIVALVTAVPVKGAHVKMTHRQLTSSSSSQ